MRWKLRKSVVGFCSTLPLIWFFRRFFSGCFFMGWHFFFFFQYQEAFLVHNLYEIKYGYSVLLDTMIIICFFNVNFYPHLNLHQRRQKKAHYVSLLLPLNRYLLAVDDASNAFESECFCRQFYGILLCITWLK